MPYLIYSFEHWQNGHMVGTVRREATSTTEAVSKLSESLKGVFKLVKKERKIVDKGKSKLVLWKADWQ